MVLPTESLVGVETMERDAGCGSTECVQLPPGGE